MIQSSRKQQTATLKSRNRLLQARVKQLEKELEFATTLKEIRDHYDIAMAMNWYKVKGEGIIDDFDLFRQKQLALDKYCNALSDAEEQK